MNIQQEIKDVTQCIQVPSQGNIFCNKIYRFKLHKDYYKDILTSIIIIKLLVNLICGITVLDLLGLRFKSENNHAINHAITLFFHCIHNLHV